jgi:hypothetical protein
MLHSQRTRYVLPIWLGNFYQQAFTFHEQFAKLEVCCFLQDRAINKSVWYENIKAVQVNYQKASQ